MEHSKLKVGMTVIANKDSNSVYDFTNAHNNCKGIVRTICDNTFKLEITENTKSSCIGSILVVRAKYFDIVEENMGMVVELKEVRQASDFEYGDLLIFEKGKQVLVIADSDGNDYRGIILGNYQPTDFKCSKTGFVKMLEEQYVLGSLVRVIKVNNLKLIEI